MIGVIKRPFSMPPFAPERPRPMVVSHRGLFTVAQENTLAAFVAAADAGADAVEIDLTMTRDGFIVCFHDDGEARTGLLGRTGFEPCRNMWSDLAAISLERHVHYDARAISYPSAPRTPLLSEVFEEVGHRLYFILDVRTIGAGMPLRMRLDFATRVAREVMRAGLLDRCIFSSFDAWALHRILAATKGKARTAFQWDDSAPFLGALLGDNANLMLTNDAARRLPRLLDKLKVSRWTGKVLGSHGAASIEFTGLDPTLIKRLKRRNLIVGTYTLFPIDRQGTEHNFTDAQQAVILRKLIDAGLDWVETDEPKKVMALLER